MTDSIEPENGPVTSETSEVPPVVGGVPHLRAVPEAEKPLLKGLTDVTALRKIAEEYGLLARGPRKMTAYVWNEEKGYGFNGWGIRLVCGRDGNPTSARIFGKNHPFVGNRTARDEFRDSVLAAAQEQTSHKWPETEYVSRYREDEDRIPLPPEIRDALPENRIEHREKVNGHLLFRYMQVNHPGERGRGKYTSWVRLKGLGWVSGQPDELPLYGSGDLDGETWRVYIHEGGKAAKRVLQHVTPTGTYYPDHPWCAELFGPGIVNIAWAGGGDAYENADWSPLGLIRADTEICIAADDDTIGVEAAEGIAALPEFRRFSNVKIIEFPRGRYKPSGFDLGDTDLWPAKKEAPNLLSFARRPNHIGRADAIEWTHHGKAVADRLSERGLAFQIGRQVVLIGRDKSAIFKDPSDKTKTKPAEMLHADIVTKPEQLIEVVERVSQWRGRPGGRPAPGQQLDDDGLVRKPVPDKLLRILISNPSWFAPLAGIVDHAAIRNGELLSGPIGYDKVTCIYIDSPKVEVRKWTDPKAALEFLREDWLGPFPFETPEDRVRALLIPLTLLLRRTEVRGGAPFAFVTANYAQTGKSLLVRVAYAAISGILPPAVSFPTNEEEFKKQLLACLLEAPSMIHFDNVKNGWNVGFPDLDSYSTSEQWSARILGMTKQRVVPSMSFLAFCGNNISPDGDTRTRSFEVRLQRGGDSEDDDDNVEDENPALRDVLNFTAERRGDILGALYAISQVPAERPTGQTPTRFPEWEEKVAHPLIKVSGVNDLLADMAEERAAVTAGSSELEEVLKHLHRLQEEKGYATAKQALEDESTAKSLRLLFRLKDDNPLTSSIVGNRMRSYRGHQAGGLRLNIIKDPHAQAKKKSNVFMVSGTPRM